MLKAMATLEVWFGPAIAAALAATSASSQSREGASAAPTEAAAPDSEANPEDHAPGEVFRAPSFDDVADDLIVGPPEPIEACEQRLEDAGVTFASSRIPVHENKSGITCGAPQAVRYVSGPGKIRWSGKPKVACPVAMALSRFEVVVQEEAERHLGRAVKKIRHMGTYNCREMAAYPGWVSEHSYANAIDIRSFTLAGGKEIPVLGNYGEPGAPKTRAERFLQAVARRTVDEDIFSVVLTPAFDRLHRNHFHLDMARYRVDGTVPD